MKPKVSIIIVNWNVVNLLRQCLDSLKTLETTIAHEIIVVDNASTDDSVATVRTHYPNVKLIANKENLGFARANNQAIAQAQGEYLLFLNPDTIAKSSSLQLMIDELEQHPEYGIVAPQILNPDLTSQPSIRRDPTWFNQLLVLAKIINVIPSFPGLRQYLQLDFDYGRQQEVEQVKGAAFMMPRSVLESVGLWDDHFYLWFEEIDLCLRVRESGKKIIYLPKSKIIHHGGASFAQGLTIRNQQLFNQSLRYYAHKHFTLVGRLAINVMIPINIMLTVFWAMVKKIIYGKPA